MSSSDATVAGAALQGVGGTTVPDVGGITINVEVLRSGYKLLFPDLVHISFGDDSLLGGIGSGRTKGQYRTFVI